MRQLFCDFYRSAARTTQGVGIGSDKDQDICLQNIGNEHLNIVKLFERENFAQLFFHIKEPS